MKILKLASVWILSLLFANSSWADCAGVESIPSRISLPHVTIQKIIQQALSTHPQIAKSENTYKSSLDDIAIARAARFPQVNLNFDSGISENPVAFGKRGEMTTNALGVSAGLLLFDFGTVSHQVAAAFDRSINAQSAIENQQYTVALSAIQSYLDVLRQRLALDISLNAYNDIKDIKQQLTDCHLASETDIQKAWQVKDAVCTSVIGLQNDNVAASNLFESVLNFQPNDMYLVDPQTPAVEIDPEKSMAMALQNNPSFAVSDAQINETSELTIAARRDRLPKVSLVGTTHDYHQNSPDFGGKERDGGFVGVRVTVPIFTGGKIKANIDKADLNYKNSVLDREVLTRNIRRQIKNLSQTISSETEHLKHLQSVVAMSQNVYSNLREHLIVTVGGKEKVDSQNLFNILDERGKLYKAQIELNALKYSLILDHYNLLALQGNLLNSDGIEN